MAWSDRIGRLFSRIGGWIEQIGGAPPTPVPEPEPEPVIYPPVPPPTTNYRNEELSPYFDPNSDYQYSWEEYRELTYREYHDEVEWTGEQVWGEEWPLYRDQVYEAVMVGWELPDVDTATRTAARRQYMNLMAKPGLYPMAEDFPWDAWMAWYEVD